MTALYAPKDYRKPPPSAVCHCGEKIVQYEAIAPWGNWFEWRHYGTGSTWCKNYDRAAPHPSRELRSRG